MDMLRMFGGVQLLAPWIRLETHYFFALLGLLLPLAFLVNPRLRFLDELLALLVVGVCVYFFTKAELRATGPTWGKNADREICDSKGS